MTDLTAFHKFPELPKEVRQMIWKATWPGPRAIHVGKQTCAHFTLDRDELLGDVDTWEEWTGAIPDDPTYCAGPWCFCSSDLNYHDVPFRLIHKYRPENPVALSVCADSRAISMMKYKLAFGTADLFFDFEGDFLFFENVPARHQYPHDDLVRWKEGPQIILPESMVYKDLMKVQNVIVSAEIVLSLSLVPTNPYEDPIEDYCGGVALREYL